AEAGDEPPLARPRGVELPEAPLGGVVVRVEGVEEGQARRRIVEVVQPDVGDRGTNVDLGLVLERLLSTAQLILRVAHRIQEGVPVAARRIARRLLLRADRHNAEPRRDGQQPYNPCQSMSHAFPLHGRLCPFSHGKAYAMRSAAKKL